MIDNQQKRIILQKILNSSEFSESRISRLLLAYLIESSIKGITPKETSIAKEVFGKDKNFNPIEDTLVRVHIHNLRKKLEKYYEHEGRKDKIRIIIPKGHYEVLFIPQRHLNQEIKKLFNKSNLILIFIIITLLFLCFYLFSENQSLKGKYYIVDRENPIWKEFLVENKPVMIVIGDFFFLKQYRNDIKRGLRIRDVYINSYEDLQAFKKKYPQYNDLFPDTMNTFIHKDYAWCLQDFLKIFFSFQKNVSFKLVSRLSLKDLINNNVIFLGSFKRIGIFKKFFQYSHFKFQLYSEETSVDWKNKFWLYPNQKILYKPDNKDTTIIYERVGSVLDSHNDYAIVAKFPGPNNNKILFFASFYSAGIYEAVRTFTQRESLRAVEEEMRSQLGHIPENFEILFEAIGIDRTGYKIEIKQIHGINSNINIWHPSEIILSNSP